MYSLSGSSGSDESVSPDSEVKVVRVSQELLIWSIRLIAVAYIIGILIYVWQDEELRLHAYHYMIRCFQEAARVFGSFAILSEQKYYEIVDTLH